MSRQQSIKAQIKRASEILPKIEDEYNNSLHKKEINEELKLDIQTFAGHLRSALDYLAKDIVEKYCPGTTKTYFPIRHDSESFIRMMTESYPNLVSSAPDLYSYLESIQPYSNPDNAWIGHFNKINNENKHNDLVEQKRIENRRVSVLSKTGGGSVSWGSGVRFGNGVSVMGVPIDPNTQLPVQNEIVNTEIVTWVDFKFKDIDISALKLLKESLQKISVINDKVATFL